MQLQRRSLVLASASAFATTLLGGCGEGFFFVPDKLTYSTPERLGVAAEDVFFDNGRGFRLHAWWMPAVGTPRATLVHAHGNAANLTNHAPIVRWFPAAGINVLTFDYRGYGQSEGLPTLNGLVNDTIGAIAEARRRSAGLPLIVLGQSLGGATAVRAVAQDNGADIRLLIVDSAFSSYRGIAHEAASHGVLSLVAPLAMPGLPSADDDPLAAIRRVRCPVLLMHGERDHVIAIQHSEMLYDAAPAGRKQFIRIPDGRHIDGLTRRDIRERVFTAISAAL